MPDFAGTWKMKSSENFDELLKALGVNSILRKIAVKAASTPHVEVKQNGEQFYIKTSTTVRTTEVNFLIGEEFNEETVDGKKCKSLATWETENKIYCRQTLLSGNGPKTFWSREIRGDELILVLKSGPYIFFHKIVTPKGSAHEPDYKDICTLPPIFKVCLQINEHMFGRFAK